MIADDEDKMMRTCTVCSREYAVDSFSRGYTLGTCPYCHVTDYSNERTGRGRLFNTDHDEEEFEDWLEGRVRSQR
jgi:hypothetical protein